MANERAVLVTELRVDDQLTGKLGAAKGQLTQLDATARKAGSSVGGLGSSLGGIAKAGATAFVAFKALDLASDFLGGSVGAASKLNETMSKSAVIFGQSAGQVAAWGNTAARAFGQSQQQAVEAAATFGNLFKTMGLGQQDVLDMSGAVVELASDLASFNNIGVDEALLKLRSGLVGEVEPLRTLGVALNETVVRTKAVQLGLGTMTGTLSESAKVQARYALILEQTKTAQGDFARTSGGLANQQKILAAQVDNLSASFGQMVVGPLTSLVSVVNTDVLPGLGKVGEAIGGIEGAATIAGAALTIKLVPGLYAAAAGFTAVELGALASAKAIGIASAAFLATPFAVFIAGTEAANVAEEKLLNTKQQGILESIRSGEAFDRETSALHEVTGGAEAAAATTRVYLAAEREATAAAAALASGTVGLTGDTVALTAATQAGAAAMLAARGATLEATKAAALGAAELAKWEAIAGDSSAELNNDLLTAASGMDGFTASTDTSAGALGRWTDAMKAAFNTAQSGRLGSSQDAFEQFGPAAPLTGSNGGASTGDVFNLKLKQAADLKAQQDRDREEAARKAQAAADKALAEAKRRAEEEARAYEKALGRAFDNAKQRAISLFDTLHNRHVQAIKDAETLAEKQHAGALKVIEDALKFSRFANAAPVTAAQTALDERQQAQSRRGLVESLSAAQLAAQTNTDPKAAADLARALRDATEALENFDDAAKIARLTTVQKTQDDKDAATAAKLTAAADRQLADAKAQAQKDTDAETIAAAKRKKDFETALDKVERASLKAKDTPAEQQAAIAKLEKQFGITTDKSGFHHIDDPLVTAIKNVTIQPPVVYVTSNYNPVFQVSGRAVAVALASGASPTSTPMVRTGAAGRS